MFLVERMLALAGILTGVFCGVAGSSHNWTQHALDWRALARLDFKTAFPSHDIKTGVPKAAVVEFAEKLARS